MLLYTNYHIGSFRKSRQKSLAQNIGSEVTVGRSKKKWQLISDELMTMTVMRLIENKIESTQHLEETISII